MLTYIAYSSFKLLITVKLYDCSSENIMHDMCKHMQNHRLKLFCDVTVINDTEKNLFGVLFNNSTRNLVIRIIIQMVCNKIKNTVRRTSKIFKMSLIVIFNSVLSAPLSHTAYDMYCWPHFYDYLCLSKLYR